MDYVLLSSFFVRFVHLSLKNDHSSWSLLYIFWGNEGFFRTSHLIRNILCLFGSLFCTFFICLLINSFGLFCSSRLCLICCCWTTTRIIRDPLEGLYLLLFVCNLGRRKIHQIKQYNLWYLVMNIFALDYNF